MLAEEVAPDGTNDEGVFQINEGTNITISATHSNSSNVMQVDLLGQLGDGSSVGKLSWLEKESLSNGVKGKLSPTDPFFELVPASTDNKSEFYQNKNIQEIFRTSSVGIATANDALTIHFTKAEIVEQLQTLKSIKFEDIEAEKANKPEPDKWKIAYDFHSKQPKLIQKKEAQDWRLKWAVDDISAVPEPVSKVTEVKYRPFDNRWSFYSGKTRGFICRPRGGRHGEPTQS